MLDEQTAPEWAMKAAEEIGNTFFPLLREGKCNGVCEECRGRVECSIAEAATIATMADIIRRHIP